MLAIRKDFFFISQIVLSTLQSTQFKKSGIGTNIFSPLKKNKGMLHRRNLGWKGAIKFSLDNLIFLKKGVNSCLLTVCLKNASHSLSDFCLPALP